MAIFKKNYIIIFGLLLVLFFGILSHWNTHPLYLLIFSVYILLSGYTLTRALLPFSKFHSLLFTPVCAALPLLIGGAGIYFFYKIDTIAILLLLSLPALSAFFADIFFCGEEKNIFQKKQDVHTIYSFIFTSIFFFSIAFFWYIILHSHTEQAVLGPWTSLQKQIFIPYFIAALSLIGIILSRAHQKISIISLCTFFFSSFSVILFVFPLGFGFDPHLHQATEKTIAEQGFILPKQLYYLGQYALIAFLTKLLTVPADLLDTFFVPILSALGLPLAALLCARAYGLSQKGQLLFVFFSLLIPFEYTVFTVPWNIASIFTLIFSYVSIAYIRFKYKGILIFLLLLALGALSIHPLAGLPLLGVFLCLLAYNIFATYEKKNIFIGSIALIFSISIPLAFFVNSLLSSQLEIVLKKPSFQSFQRLFDYFSFHTDTRFSAPLDFIYSIYQNGGILLVFLALWGILYAAKMSFFSRKKALFPLLGSGICIINFLVIEEFFSFTSLISYEQHAYADRILSLTIFFLIPPCIYSIVILFEKILNHPSRTLKIIFLVFFSGMLTGSFYLSYPSNDVYRSFHGYNVSKGDILAVRVIQAHAKKEPYIVLSNQVVSAAAVKEFGFKKYFDISQNGSVRQYFAYPIPTSSPLYGYFLDMQKYPNKKTVESAMQLFGVQRAYFVVTRYEDRYATLIDQAKSFADFSTSTANGADMIFGYTK